MSFLNRTTQFFQAIGRQFVSAVTDLSGVLGMLIKRPFHDLRLARKSNSETDHESHRKSDPGNRWKRIAMLPLSLVLAIVSIAVRILMSPAELLVGLAQRKSKKIIWTIPAFVALLGLIGVAYASWLNSDARLGPLRRSAYQSYDDGKFETAVSLFAELNEKSKRPQPQDLFQWSMALKETEQIDESIAILKSLAPGPDESPGYPAAHRIIAINIAASLKGTVNPATLKTWRWHLECGGESRAPLFNRAWAEYDLLIDDKENALRHMKLAAEVRPEYMTRVAKIYGMMGNQFARQQALEQAKKFFEKLIAEQNKINDKLSDKEKANEKNPHRVRILYAKLLNEMNQTDLAEQVLLEAERRNPTPAIKVACAEFYLAQFHRTGPSGEFADRFDFLKKSLEHDLNHVASYQELIVLYQREGNSSESVNSKEQRILKMLRDAITADESAAFAHFALSNIFWVDKNVVESRIHMERAFEIDQRFAVIANNLAWLLAHDEKPDLDRAFEIATQVVQKKPNAGRFRDTLATILMKQGKWEQALAEFEKALPTMPRRGSVHKKMAEIYRILNMDGLAEQHDLQSGN